MPRKLVVPVRAALARAFVRRLAAVVTFVRAAFACAGLAALGSAGAGCNLHTDGVAAPDNRIFYPSGGVVAPGGRWLMVVNSNSDLRYASGTVAVVDLDAVRKDDPRVAAPGAGPEWPVCPPEPRYVPPAAAPHACCWDYLDRNILSCDEQAYIHRERTIRIGSFASRPAIQTLAQPIGGDVAHRLLVPVRGDNSITVVGMAATPDDITLTCTGPRPGPARDQPRFAACDENWKITRLRDPLTDPSALETPADEIVRLPEEPFALAVDDALKLLYVAHLRGSAVSLIDLGDGTDVETPKLAYIGHGLVPVESNGAAGITSLKISTPGNCGQPVYLGSRLRPVVTSFIVVGLGSVAGGSCAAPAEGNTARDLVIVPSGSSFATGLPGTEIRGVELMPADPRSGQVRRAFLLQRTPPAVVAVDLDVGNVPSTVIEVCDDPANLAMHVGLDGPMLYVTCFKSNQVYVIEPAVPRLRAVISVGRGPAATVFDPADPTRGYVIGFGGNNVSVIDVDPSSPRQFRVIQRIGFTSATPRQVASQ